MKITGPQPVQITAPIAQAVVTSVSFNMVDHTFTIAYGDGNPGHMKTITGPMPAGVITAVANHAQAMIENAEGWGAGSSTTVP